MTVGIILSGNLPGWAEDDIGWPTEIYFPQRAPKAPVGLQNTPQEGSVSGSTGVQVEKAEKTGIWPFRHEAKQETKKPKKKDKKQKPPTEEQITQVGPKDPPAYPDPLLRLTFPIQTEAGVIPPGFYLVRQIEKHEAGRTLALTRQHQILFTFQVSAVTDGSESPIQPSDRTAPPKTSVDARLSADQKTLTLLLTEGAKRFESQPFATVLDNRKILAP
jgi:hypothetical protein